MAVEGGSEIGRHMRGLLMALRGVRMNLKPAVRRILERIGDKPIAEIRVIRRPLSSKVKALMRLMGVGGEHDRFFHLFLAVQLYGQAIQWVVEKNEDLNIKPYQPVEIDEAMPVPVPKGLTLTKLFENAIVRIPKQRLFHYDAFSSNCQRFIVDVLQASNVLMTPPMMEFILQDVSKLAKKWQQRLAGFFTSLANRGKLAIVGEGVVILN